MNMEVMWHFARVEQLPLLEDPRAHIVDLHRAHWEPNGTLARIDCSSVVASDYGWRVRPDVAVHAKSQPLPVTEARKYRLFEPPCCEF